MQGTSVNHLLLSVVTDEMTPEGQLRSRLTTAEHALAQLRADLDERLSRLEALVLRAPEQQAGRPLRLVDEDEQS